MIEWLSDLNWKNFGFFLGGVLFGTAGIKALSTKDAKRTYVKATAAALRAKDSVMETVDLVQENAEDIYAQALELNQERARCQQQEVYEDEADEVVMNLEEAGAGQPEV